MQWLSILLMESPPPSSQMGLEEASMVSKRGNFGVFLARQLAYGGATAKFGSALVTLEQQKAKVCEFWHPHQGWKFTELETLLPQDLLQKLNLT